MTTLNTDVESQTQLRATDAVDEIAGASSDKDDVNQTQHQELPSRDPFFVGVETALHSAAIKARKRAIALNGYVATWRDGKVVYDTEP